MLCLHSYRYSNASSDSETNGTGKPVSPMVLKGLDVKIRSGEFIGIAGTTGAGKSTLVKLLLRLYDATSGHVLVGKRDVRDVSIPDLRQKVALVSQDVYLFHGTIYENIAYGASNADPQAVLKVSKMAQFDDFVQSLPDGYQTLVGERGIKLSGGQRQRLSIARALLKDSPILVLDEATSSVDTETERALQQNLAIFAQGRTAIVIAHRLSTIRFADRILVLKDGRVAEEGTHDQLLAMDGKTGGERGIYKGLWDVQIGNASTDMAGQNSSHDTTKEGSSTESRAKPAGNKGQFKPTVYHPSEQSRRNIWDRVK